MENSKEIFNIALGLQEPWFVNSIDFKDKGDEKVLYIELSFTRGSRFKGSDGKLYSAHDTVERTWQHLNFFQHRCFLKAKVPKIKQDDGQVPTVQGTVLKCKFFNIYFY